MGVPKALVRGEDGVPWLASSRQVLLDGGCAEVLTVLGAEGEQAAKLIDNENYLIASDWETGMGASLRAGLQKLSERSDIDTAIVHLVDLPDVDAAVVERVIALARSDRLVRAVFRDEPGHPVAIGRTHWPALIDQPAGDEGARRYLAAHSVIEVECADLATGQDVDTPEEI